jgi:hypothetical protein
MMPKNVRDLQSSAMQRVSVTAASTIIITEGIFPILLVAGRNSTDPNAIIETTDPKPAMKRIFEFTLTWLDLTNGGMFMRTIAKNPRNTTEQITAEDQPVPFVTG